MTAAPFEGNDMYVNVHTSACFESLICLMHIKQVIVLYAYVLGHAKYS